MDDGASVDSVEDESEEEAAQQDIDMVRYLEIQSRYQAPFPVDLRKTHLKSFLL